MLCVLPVFYTGWPGLLTIILLVLFVRKRFLYLYRTDLRPDGRIRLMKTVTAANLFGNGAYILGLALGACLRLVVR